MFKCKNCGIEFEKSSMQSNNYCSYKCYEQYKRYNDNSNCECAVCKKKMYMKPFRLKRIKNDITCSKKCSSILKQIYFLGKNNHQYGLKGHLNSSFINNKTITNYGYVKIYLPNHPYSDKYGRFWEHRYVIEQYSSYDDSYFEIMNEQKVLKKKYHVHHINENKSDNRIENLIILTKSQHISLHSKQKEIVRNNTNGKIIGVIKKGEFNENPEEDNIEPSIRNEYNSTNEGAEHSN